MSGCRGVCCTGGEGEAETVRQAVAVCGNELVGDQVFSCLAEVGSRRQVGRPDTDTAVAEIEIVRIFDDNRKAGTGPTQIEKLVVSDNPDLHGTVRCGFSRFGAGFHDDVVGGDC